MSDPRSRVVHTWRNDEYAKTFVLVNVCEGMAKPRYVLGYEDEDLVGKKCFFPLDDGRPRDSKFDVTFILGQAIDDILKKEIS